MFRQNSIVFSVCVCVCMCMCVRVCVIFVVCVVPQPTGGRPMPSILVRAYPPAVAVDQFRRVINQPLTRAIAGHAVLSSTSIHTHTEHIMQCTWFRIFCLISRPQTVAAKPAAADRRPAAAASRSDNVLNDLCAQRASYVRQRFVGTFYATRPPSLPPLVVG